MKTTLKILSLPILIALGTGCSKMAETDTPAGEKPAGRIIVHADVAETRTTIAKEGDTYKMSWDGDETAKLVQKDNKGTNASFFASGTIELSGTDAAFPFEGIESVEGATSYKYAILYPASAVGSASGSAVTLTLPANQTPKAATPDPAASLLAGRDATSYTAQPSSLDVTFGHLAAYGKMTMKFGSYGADTKVTSITITAEDCNIAGALTYNAETGDVDYSTGASTIVLDGANLTPAYGGYDIWFACKPFTLPQGKKLTIVTVTSDKGTQTAELTAAQDIEFPAGKVTSFPTYGITYTITFNTQGGSAIDPVQVGRGQKVKQPADPTMTGTLTQGLYAGNVDPAQGAAFEGWYEDAACTMPFDFETQIWSNKTLYAKWNTPASIDVSGEDVGTLNASDPAKLINRSITYINAQTLDAETHYTMVLTGNGTIWGGTIASLNNANAVLHIVGGGAERRITTSNNANLLVIASGTLVLGKNILLNFNGTGTHNYPVLDIQSATSKAMMEEGSRIDDCTFAKTLININANGSTFIMNGGSISNNTASSSQTSMAPVYCNWGIFIMNGGSISGNTVTGTAPGANLAGGVLVTSWANQEAHHFIKNGGVISGNTASRDCSDAITGYRGNQVLYLGPKKKLDSDIPASVNLTTMDNSCYSAPWQTAPQE